MVLRTDQERPSSTSESQSGSELDIRRIQDRNDFEKALIRRMWDPRALKREKITHARTEKELFSYENRNAMRVLPVNEKIINEDDRLVEMGSLSSDRLKDDAPPSIDAPPTNMNLNR